MPTRRPARKRALWPHIKRFVEQHRGSEGAIAEALTIDIVWALLRQFVFGAAVASAAVATALALQTSTYHPPVSLSVKGAAFLTRYEGVRYAPYNDPWNCTVGTGHLIHYGYCTASDYARWRITPAQNLALLMHDSSSAAACVSRAVTRHIDGAQADALVSLTFNIGCGGFQTSSIARDVNADNLRGLASAWPYFYTTADGRYLAGLHTRRVAESHLYLTGDYGPGIGRYVPPKPVNPRKVPRPVPKWSWKLAAWRLERYPYRSCKRRPACRPKSAPRQAPEWFWIWIRRFK